MTSDSPAAKPRIFYGWVVVSAAFTALFVAVGAQTGVIGAFAKPMTDALGWSRSELFLADTMGQILMAGMGVMLGPYVDRLGGRRMMLAGIALMLPGLILISQVDSLWQWLLVRGVLLISGASLVGFLVTNVTVSKWFVVQRGRALGVTTMGVSLAGVIWPPLATFAIDELGWRDAWLLIALIVGLLALPAALLMRRQPEDFGLQPDGGLEMTDEIQRAVDEDFENSLTRREALGTSAFYLIVFTFGISVIGVFAILTQAIPFLTDEGFSRGTAALLSSSMSIAAMITKPPWGWATERFSSKALGSWSFAIAGFGFILVVLAAGSGSVPLVAVGMFITGTGIGGNIPIQEVIWGECFGRRHLGAVRSLGIPFGAAISAGTPLGLAVYFDTVGNYDGALYGCAGLWLAAAILILGVRRPTKTAVAAAPAAPSG